MTKRIKRWLNEPVGDTLVIPILTKQGLYKIQVTKVVEDEQKGISIVAD